MPKAPDMNPKPEILGTPPPIDPLGRDLNLAKLVDVGRHLVRHLGFLRIRAKGLGFVGVIWLGMFLGGIDSHLRNSRAMIY